MLQKKMSLLLISVLAVAASSSAMAQGVVNVKSEVVRFDDLRLISNVGAAVLYGRLQRAAERACGGPSDQLQLSQHQRFRACFEETLSKAVGEVNHPILSAYFDNKRKAPGGLTTPSQSSVAKTR
jgi:UrcA family protein